MKKIVLGLLLGLASSVAQADTSVVDALTLGVVQGASQDELKQVVKKAVDESSAEEVAQQLLLAYAQDKNSAKKNTYYIVAGAATIGLFILASYYGYQWYVKVSAASNDSVVTPVSSPRGEQPGAPRKNGQVDVDQVDASDLIDHLVSEVDTPERDADIQRNIVRGAGVAGLLNEDQAAAAFEAELARLATQSTTVVEEDQRSDYSDAVSVATMVSDGGSRYPGRHRTKPARYMDMSPVSSHSAPCIGCSLHKKTCYSADELPKQFGSSKRKNKK